MNLGFDIIVLDLELNKPDSNDFEILEIGAIKYSRNHEITSKYFSICLYTSIIEKEITDLTGIDNVGRLDRPTFTEIFPVFYDWCVEDTKNIFLGCWGNDVYLLKSYCKRLNIDWPFRGTQTDIKSISIILSNILNNKPKSYSLDRFLNFYNLGFDDKYGKQHRALPDAYNTARLLKHQFDMFQSIKDNINKVLEFYK